MTLAQPQRKWTIEEFFAWHEHQEERYELIAGVPTLKYPPVPVTLPGATAPTMMTGASLRHGKVNGNLSRIVGNQLRGGFCNVFSNDAAVRTGIDQFRYPDIVVDCQTPPDRGYVLEHPRLLVEILSPTTKSFDLAGKLTEYWQIETLAYVLIIDPDRLRVQMHDRSSGGAPVLHILDNRGDIIEIVELGLTLNLAEIFEGLSPISQ